MSRIFYGAAAAGMAFGIFDLVMLGRTYTPTKNDLIFDFALFSFCAIVSVITEKKP